MLSLDRTILFAVALALIVGGCKSGKQSQPQTPETVEIPKPQEDWSQQPISVPGGRDLPVKQGPAPLIFLVEQPNLIRVVDMTSGEVLLRMPVTARTVVAVEPKIGVRVGAATMKLGPLPADHLYGIYVESSETNIMRRGTIRPGQPGASQQPPVTTQPARTR